MRVPSGKNTGDRFASAGSPSVIRRVSATRADDDLRAAVGERRERDARAVGREARRELERDLRRERLRARELALDAVRAVGRGRRRPQHEHRRERDRRGTRGRDDPAATSAGALRGRAWRGLRRGSGGGQVGGRVAGRRAGRGAGSAAGSGATGATSR